jgi:hypothetical protein
MRLKGWSVGRLVAILDRVIVLPESTGWPCPRDGDHDDFHRERTTRAPEVAAIEVPPNRDGGIEPATDSSR